MSNAVLEYKKTKAQFSPTTRTQGYSRGVKRIARHSNIGVSYMVGKGNAQPEVLNQVNDYLIQYQESFYIGLSSMSVGGLDFEFPEELRGIFKGIEGSISLLRLQDNWDDEGAIAITMNTWQKMATFLSRYSLFVYENFQIVLEVPDIAPVPDGSIDFTWKNEDARLLMNFKVDDDIVGFYGDYYSDKHTFKGMLPTDEVIDFFCSWLKIFED